MKLNILNNLRNIGTEKTLINIRFVPLDLFSCLEINKNNNAEDLSFFDEVACEGWQAAKDIVDLLTEMHE